MPCRECKSIDCPAGVLGCSGLGSCCWELDGHDSGSSQPSLVGQRCLFLGCPTPQLKPTWLHLTSVRVLGFKVSWPMLCQAPDSAPCFKSKHWECLWGKVTGAGQNVSGVPSSAQFPTHFPARLAAQQEAEPEADQRFDVGPGIYRVWVQDFTAFSHCAGSTSQQPPFWQWGAGESRLRPSSGHTT